MTTLPIRPETAAVARWINAHEETIGRVQAAVSMPSEDPVQHDLAVALRGWVTEQIAPDREPLDLALVDWSLIADLVLEDVRTPGGPGWYS